MNSGSRRQQVLLKTARYWLLIGITLLFAAGAIAFFSLNCSDINGVQNCVRSTYFGMNANTFALVLLALSAILLGTSALFLRQKGQEPKAPESSDAPSMSKYRRQG